MGREEFMAYVQSNFKVSSGFIRLLDNVLHYAELQCFEEDELNSYLSFMLDGCIGLSEDEIEKVIL